MSRSHTHTDEQGVLVRCYHKTMGSWKAWVLAGFIAMTAYPVEHYIWENVAPFNTVAEFLGVGVGNNKEESK